jgi:hypothetical protein
METPYREDCNECRKHVLVYCLFKCGILSINIKLTLYKALVRSDETCACPPL